ncbi:MAG: hypothetical protein CEE38_17350 [Planctomycetes bacterium B3_Pla]|nr:MAG: hypothetical protein CEE38_17350 [Planctomycetes bacterium B3_Pla]
MMLSLEEHKKLGAELNGAIRSAEDRWLIISKAYGKGSNQARLTLHAFYKLDCSRYSLDAVLADEQRENYDQSIYFPDKTEKTDLLVSELLTLE